MSDVSPVIKALGCILSILVSTRFDMEQKPYHGLYIR